MWIAGGILATASLLSPLPRLVRAGRRRWIGGAPGTACMELHGGAMVHSTGGNGGVTTPCAARRHQVAEEHLSGLLKLLVPELVVVKEVAEHIVPRASRVVGGPLAKPHKTIVLLEEIELYRAGMLASGSHVALVENQPAPCPAHVM